MMSKSKSKVAIVRLLIIKCIFGSQIMTLEETCENAIEIYQKYIEANGQRKTPERIAILREIYSLDGHFDADGLHKRMIDKKYMVSKATIYNSIEHLLICKLIRKHQFNDKYASYERCLESNQHDHIIIDGTGEVLEFCDPRIQQIKSTIEDIFGLEVTGHSLYFYAKKKD